MLFVKSVYTGQVYCLDEMPKYEGYELSTKEEFIEFYTSRGIDPKTVTPFDRMFKDEIKKILGEV